MSGGVSAGAGATGGGVSETGAEAAAVFSAASSAAISFDITAADIFGMPSPLPKVDLNPLMTGTLITLCGAFSAGIPPCCFAASKAARFHAGRSAYSSPVSFSLNVGGGGGLSSMLSSIFFSTVTASSSCLFWSSGFRTTISTPFLSLGRMILIKSPARIKIFLIFKI
ncbi:MAG TPA: hypothetical protein DDY82_00010 [Clostridiales bacterium]|nr:hypothetical protein [Clostridiales bacterium]